MRQWIGRRRHFGMYDQLMVELRNEDHASFTNFMRMPPVMFDDLLARVGPRITKQYTLYRDPLEPGMRLALTLRHLSSASSPPCQEKRTQSPGTVGCDWVRWVEKVMGFGHKI